MKTPRILWSLAAAALLLSACSESPTSPTRITSIPSSAQKVQAATRNTATLGPALGAGTATNNEVLTGWFTLVVFEFGDGVNQIDRGRFTADAAPGQQVQLSTGVEGENDCTTYQVDVFWMMPKAARYTLSDTRNYPTIASRMVYPKASCRLPPTRPEPPPVCDTRGSGSFDFTHLGEASWMAIFPLGFANPWYAEQLGPFPLTAGLQPGTYRLDAMTGDPEHWTFPDLSDDQKHEQVRFRFGPSGIVSAATTDVPENEVLAASYLGEITVTEWQGTLTVEHAGARRAVPAESVQPVSLTWTKVRACQ